MTSLDSERDLSNDYYELQMSLYLRVFIKQ